MEKKIRITKAQRFEDIKALLNGEGVMYGTTIEIANDFIDHEMELLAKKNSSDSKKLTAKQVENEHFKERIVEFLLTLSHDSKGVTCTEILKAIPEMESNQKVSALMTQLKTMGTVVAERDKGKTLFSLA